MTIINVNYKGVLNIGSAVEGDDISGHLNNITLLGSVGNVDYSNFLRQGHGGNDGSIFPIGILILIAVIGAIKKGKGVSIRWKNWGQEGEIRIKRLVSFWYDKLTALIYPYFGI